MSIRMPIRINIRMSISCLYVLVNTPQQIYAASVFRSPCLSVGHTCNPAYGAVRTSRCVMQAAKRCLNTGCVLQKLRNAASVLGGGICISRELSALL